MTTVIEALKTVLVVLVETVGYAGLGLLSLLENLIPPIPSEFVVPFAGFLAAEGRLSVTWVLVATTVGGLLGTTAFYFVGRRMGEERVRKAIQKFGRYVLLQERDFDSALQFFQGHDAAVVFWGRFVPGVRSLISIPAGIAAMPLGRFMLYTTVGTLLWNTALVMAGWFLGDRWEVVTAAIDRFEIVLWVIVGVVVVLLVLRKMRGGGKYGR